MHTRVAYAVLLACCGLSADTPTVYVGDRYEHRIAAIATDLSGNTYVTGSRSLKSPPPGSSYIPVEKPEVFVAKLDGTSQRLWIQYFSGKEIDSGAAIVADRDGNVYVAGTTTSLNFPLRNPLQSEPAGSFLMKLAADASRVLWSTYYGVATTRITSIALAPDGALVVGGSAMTDSFLSTRAFAAKIDVTANKILWEQSFGGSQLACTGGSSCFLSSRNNSAAVAVDSAGNIYAAGNTNTLDFPTTPGALLEHGYGPYVRKWSPSGTLLWSTYLTNNRVGMNYPVYPADTLSAFSVGPDGSVYLTGGGSPHWPTTPGAYRTAYEGPEWPPFGPAGVPNPYVAKLNPAGTALVYSTFIGHNGAVPTALALDSSGAAYVSHGGQTDGADDYIAAVNPTGSALGFDNSYARGSRGARIAVDGSSRIHAAGAAGVVTMVDRTPPASGMSGVANAAGALVTGRVAPGELISIYGWNLGDQVWVDELPAPILYASASQVNAVVPFGVAGRERVTVTVRRGGIDTARAVVAVVRAQPEIFKGVLNQDGTLNSASNPAKAGSIVTLWGTGASGWPPDLIKDGAITPNEPLLYLGVTALAGSDVYSTVFFAGAAPGMVAGVFQMNVQLPASTYPPELGMVEIRAVSDYEISQPSYVYVRQ